MRGRISIAELLHAGATLQTAEAVAIVQQLITRPRVRFADRLTANAADQSPLGPPSPETVFLEPDGAVSCSGDATPAVSELAILLQHLLPPGTPGVAGSVRYTIARALLDVDAPPFDSVAQLSAALARFETGDRRTVVRALLARMAHADAAMASRVDRRRAAPCITDLRRQLRAADARVYEQQLALDALSAMMPARPAHIPSRLIITVAAAGALLVLLGVGEALYMRRPTPAPVVVAGPPPIAAPQPLAVVDLEAGEVNGGPVTLEPPSVATKAPERRVSHADERSAARARRPLLDRLHLKWLRGKVTIRTDAP